jgi:hypothetical protein
MAAGMMPWRLSVRVLRGAERPPANPQGGGVAAADLVEPSSISTAIDLATPDFEVRSGLSGRRDEGGGRGCPLAWRRLDLWQGGAHPRGPFTQLLFFHMLRALSLG